MNEQPRSTPDPATTALPFMGMSIALSSLYFGSSTLGLSVIGVQAVVMFVLLYVVVRKAVRTRLASADDIPLRRLRVTMPVAMTPIAVAGVVTAVTYGLFPNSDAAGTLAGVTVGGGLMFTVGAFVLRLAMRNAPR
ncbi:hypothetical protein ACGFNU_28620 [Spirillospora sp. NPDC048911]|uniref:hypothetical protein n=1 Tax=Spirillospora sp. NPDC048911 TaxID=3364527 RepID=UPI0037187F8D